MIRNMLCGEDFELQKQLTVNAVFEHLGLTTVGATTTARKIFAQDARALRDLRARVHPAVFTIQSPSSATTKVAVVERRGRVGGVWSFSLVRSIKQGGGRGNFIDEARIGAAMYNELLSEADPERKSVRKKRTVFTCHVGVCGRDVTHRVEEVVAVGRRTAARPGRRRRRRARTAPTARRERAASPTATARMSSCSPSTCPTAVRTSRPTF